MAWDPKFSFADGLALLTFCALAGGAIFSYLRFHRSIASAYYAELDKLYQDLLAKAVEHPFLRQPAAAPDDTVVLTSGYRAFPDKDECNSYNAYAHMVWCFVETVHDRCVECRDKKRRKELRNVWGPSISVENRLHRGWLLNEFREEHLRAKQGRGKTPARAFCSGFQFFAFQERWPGGAGEDWEYPGRAELDAFESELARRIEGGAEG